MPQVSVLTIMGLSNPVPLEVDSLSCRIVKLHPRIGEVVLHHKLVDVRLHDLVDDKVSRFA